MALSGDDGVWIAGNRRLLSVLIRNLLDNAIKYSLENSKIEVSAVKTGEHVSIAITDFGCGIDTESELLLKHAMTEFALSARSHVKICKVSRTIADLEGCEAVKSSHVSEAIQYRSLDRKLWL